MVHRILQLALMTTDMVPLILLWPMRQQYGHLHPLEIQAIAGLIAILKFLPFRIAELLSNQIFRDCSR